MRVSGLDDEAGYRGQETVRPEGPEGIASQEFVFEEGGVGHTPRGGLKVKRASLAR